MRALRIIWKRTRMCAIAGWMSEAVITVFVISWVWLGAFVFRNIFVGVSQLYWIANTLGHECTVCLHPIRTLETMHD